MPGTVAFVTSIMYLFHLKPSVSQRHELFRSQMTKDIQDPTAFSQWFVLTYHKYATIPKPTSCDKTKALTDHNTIVRFAGLTLKSPPHRGGSYVGRWQWICTELVLIALSNFRSQNKKVHFNFLPPISPGPVSSDPVGIGWYITEELRGVLFPECALYCARRSVLFLPVQVKSVRNLNTFSS